MTATFGSRRAEVEFDFRSHPTTRDSSNKRIKSDPDQLRPDLVNQVVYEP